MTYVLHHRISHLRHRMTLPEGSRRISLLLWNSFVFISLHDENKPSDLCSVRGRKQACQQRITALRPRLLSRPSVQTARAAFPRVLPRPVSRFLRRKWTAPEFLLIAESRTWRRREGAGGGNRGVMQSCSSAGRTTWRALVHHLVATFQLRTPHCRLLEIYNDRLTFMI